MRTPRSRSILAVFTLLSTLPAAAQVNPKNMNPAPAPRGAGPTGIGATHLSLPNGGQVHPELYRLWKQLPGRYETSDAASRLTVILRAISRYVLILESHRTAAAGGPEIVERGYITLGDVSASYRSEKKRFVLLYRPDTLRSDFSCTLYGAPSADGISFDSEASDCSFPLGRRTSKLWIDASQTAIAVLEEGGASTYLTRVAAR